MDPEQQTKLKLSIFIGFLTIALFALLGSLTVAAANGNVIARWVLGIIFGVIALALASYALGYAILAIMEAGEVEEIPRRVERKNKMKKRKNSRKSK